MKKILGCLFIGSIASAQSLAPKAEILHRVSNGFEVSILSSRFTPTGQYSRPATPKDDPQKIVNGRVSVSEKDYQKALNDTGIMHFDEEPSVGSVAKAVFAGNPFKMGDRIRQTREFEATKNARISGTIHPEMKVEAAPLSVLNKTQQDCVTQQASQLNAMIRDADTKFLIQSFGVSKIDVDFTVTPEFERSQTCRIDLVREGGTARLKIAASIRRDLSISSCYSCSNGDMKTWLQDKGDEEDAARAQQARRNNPNLAAEDAAAAQARLNSVFDGETDPNPTDDPRTDPRRSPYAPH